MIGGKDDRIGEECGWNLQDQIDFIRPPNMIVLYNQERMNIEKYGEESIERFSTLTNI